ncbi:MAG: hypothetical protein JW950_13955 [Deltaproteobacteria bacterium]|nr:hypothetical protein [Deltaproteobacteria bacterium]
MFKANTVKNPNDILREEILQERAAVLGRAGRSVMATLEQLQAIEEGIEASLAGFSRFCEGSDTACGSVQRHRIVQEINGEIRRYNKTRELAKLRFYYLIVTREALGLRKHQRVEEIYRIPPSRKYLQQG